MLLGKANAKQLRLLLLQLFLLLDEPDFVVG